MAYELAVELFQNLVCTSEFFAFHLPQVTMLLPCLTACNFFKTWCVFLKKKKTQHLFQKLCSFLPGVSGKILYTKRHRCMIKLLFTIILCLSRKKIVADCEEKTNSKVRMNLKPRLLLILMHVYWTAYSGAIFQNIFLWCVVTSSRILPCDSSPIKLNKDKGSSLWVKEEADTQHRHV